MLDIFVSEKSLQRARSRKREPAAVSGMADRTLGWPIAPPLIAV
jgi:hypothetical protein